jgi:hypothetical protein
VVLGVFFASFAAAPVKKKFIQIVATEEMELYYKIIYTPEGAGLTTRVTCTYCMLFSFYQCGFSSPHFAYCKRPK